MEIVMLVIVPYPGSVISDNNYKIHGTDFTKPVVKKWQEVLKELIIRHPKYSKFTGKQFIIRLSGTFASEASVPDLHNLHKVIGDAVKKVDGILDDKYFGFDDSKGYTIKPGPQYLELEFILR
jgi:hypothetical protein